MKFYLYLIVAFIFLSGCLSQEQEENLKNNKINFSDIQINYFSDKSVNSLEVPPDLTSPSYENSFRIREFVKNIDTKTVNLSESQEILESKQNVLKVPVDIQIKGSGNRKWLIVDKNSETVWNLSKQFLKENGFIIEKSNKEIGFMQTNYLENKPKIPSSSMGWIRSMLQSAIENVSYQLPSVDSYSIRVEPLDLNKTELHLSLSSMAEVISGSGKNETTFWQYKKRDPALEIEMLYKLMVFLGSDSAEAREKIITSSNQAKLNIEISKDINGYSKLTFNYGVEETWDNINWALSNLNIELQDKDIKEKSFYINAARTADLGIITKLFGDDAVRKIYRISIKPVSENMTDVIFYDISEKNENITKDYSADLMKRIAEELTKS